MKHSNNEKFLFILECLLCIERSVAIRTECYNEYCFSASNPVSLSQTGAQTRCIANGTKLLEITDDRIQNSLVNFLNKNSYEAGFSGYDFLTNGKRYSTSWNRINGNGIDGLNIGGQSDISYAYSYVIRSGKVVLQAGRPDDSKQGYICEDEPNCQTTGGFMLSAQCYKSYTVQTSLSWYDARYRCIQNGGDMASFDSIKTDQGLSDINDPWLNQGTAYWIGIRREEWKWQNSTLRYSNWLNGQPITYTSNDALDCLCIDHRNNWRWKVCRCNDNSPFICISGSTITTPSTATRKTTITTTVATVTTTTTTTTSSPITINRELKAEPSSVSDFKATKGIDSEVLSSTMSDDGSTFRINAPESQKPVESLGTSAAIGIGVGVGAGIVVIAVTIVVAVFIIRRKCCLGRDAKRKKEKPLQPPDIIALQTIPNAYDTNHDENPYVVVLKRPESDEANCAENQQPQNIVYADLQILCKSITDNKKRKKSVTFDLVNDDSRPESPSLIREGDKEVEEIIECNEQIVDTVTRA